MAWTEYTGQPVHASSELPPCNLGKPLGRLTRSARTMEIACKERVYSFARVFLKLTGTKNRLFWK